MSRLNTPVTPPPLLEPTVSLLRSANNPLRNDETNGRWVNGIEYQPFSNAAPQVRDSCDMSFDGTPPAQPDIVDWTPYVIHVEERCSATGWSSHGYKERLDQAMKVGRHKAVEKEFWGGALAQSASLDNVWLAKNGGATDVTPGAGAPSVKAAMQYLEQALADCGLGGRGMIHCRPEALPSFTQIRREGYMLLSSRDTIIVVGTGYPNLGPGNAAPAAGKTWLYATGMVDVRLDEDNIQYGVPTQNGDTRAADSFSDVEIVSMMDRSTNTITARAEMLALASWDQQCWFACQATLDA